VITVDGNGKLLMVEMIYTFAINATMIILQIIK